MGASDTVGVLAVQGAFAEHEHMLDALGAPWVELRSAADLARDFGRLLLPGGESTVQSKLLAEQGMLEQLHERVAAGMPVMGTCAGLILLARELEGDMPHARLGTLDVRVQRNAYGRQLGSFATRLDVAGVGNVPATFVRAPQVMRVGACVDVLAHCEGVPVVVRQGRQIGLAFHPELDGDLRLHELFLRV